MKRKERQEKAEMEEDEGRGERNVTKGHRENINTSLRLCLLHLRFGWREEEGFKEGEGRATVAEDER